MVDFFRKLFDTSDFPARWHCGTWTSAHGWLHIASDLAIFGAYFAIPASLFFFLVNRRDLPLRGVFWLFIGFILFCGTTHLIEAMIFWIPIYRVSALAKIATAIISWTTVVALIRLMPDALHLPGLKQANVTLRAAVDRHAEAERALAQTRDELEARASQLTQRERRVRDAMSAASACAVKWEVDSGQIVWAAGFEHCFEMLGIPVQPFDRWSLLLGPEEVERLAREAEAAFEEQRGMNLVLPVIRSAEPTGIRLAACPAARDGNGRAMTGMFRLLLPDAESCDA